MCAITLERKGECGLPKQKSAGQGASRRAGTHRFFRVPLGRTSATADFWIWTSTFSAISTEMKSSPTLAMRPAIPAWVTTSSPFASAATNALCSFAFFICGLRISFRASDSFGRLVAFGITCMVALQAALNMGVVTGVLPTKGLPLPFISYGGTSMAVSLAMVGLLVNIGLQVGEKEDALPGIRDKARRI